MNDNDIRKLNSLLITLSVIERGDTISDISAKAHMRGIVHITTRKNIDKLITYGLIKVEKKKRNTEVMFVSYRWKDMANYLTSAFRALQDSMDTLMSSRSVLGMTPVQYQTFSEQNPFFTLLIEGQHQMFYSILGKVSKTPQDEYDAARDVLWAFMQSATGKAEDIVDKLQATPSFKYKVFEKGIKRLLEDKIVGKRDGYYYINFNLPTIKEWKKQQTLSTSGARQEKQ